MGMFDTFIGSDGTEVQLKVGQCVLEIYHEGDSVGDIADGIYIAPDEGYVVILHGKVDLVTDDKHDVLAYLQPRALPVYSKWGGPVSIDDDVAEFNPLLRVMKEVVDKYDDETEKKK